MAVALLGISLPWIETTALAKSILKALLMKFEILEITSVFKKISDTATDFNSSIEFLVSVSTQFSAAESAKQIQEISAALPRLRKDSQVGMKLLLYEHLVIMTPELTLPHPDIQYDLLTLRLSSDIWGPYEHPIFKQTLRELADRRAENINIEFIMQGQNLFD